MNHEALLDFSFPNATARAISGALAPEASQTEVPKTRGDIELTQQGFRVRIHAADLASLRASVNSHLRWVEAATRAAESGAR